MSELSLSDLRVVGLGVLHGIDKVCRQAGVDRAAIAHLLHGTTVATNASGNGQGGQDSVSA